MRKFKIGLLLMLCFFTVFLCGIFLYGITGHNIIFRNHPAIYEKNSSYSDMHVVLEKQVPLEGIKDISVLYDMNSNDIFIYESENNTLNIKEYSQTDLQKSQLSTVTVEGGNLLIKGKKRNHRMIFNHFFGFSTGGGYTEIELPSSYSGKLNLKTVSGDIYSQINLSLKESFTVETTSGNIFLPDISAETAEIESTSGDIKIGGISAPENSSGEDINIASTSGSISIDKVMGDTMVSTSSGDVKILEGNGRRNISTTSGNITLKGDTMTWELCSSSGDIRMEAEKGDGTLKTISGEIRLELETLSGALTAQSTSGDVDIVLSKDNSFAFEASTTSGDINTFFDDSLRFSKNGNHAQGSYEKNPQENMIQIKTVSGDVRLVE